MYVLHHLFLPPTDLPSQSMVQREHPLFLNTTVHLRSRNAFKEKNIVLQEICVLKFAELRLKPQLDLLLLVTEASNSGKVCIDLTAREIASFRIIKKYPWP